ncbi:hypothetical protein [Rudaea sp.]|uniref:hypothetical protein n=1 Tax=Rudaea sp. TaxID=2136325 RepID=UPI002ED21F03
MNMSTPVIRLGLLALTGAVILGAATLHSNPVSVAPAHGPSALPVVTLDTVTVRPDTADVAVASTAMTVPVLPTVNVSASEEEVLAARIDPSDRIQILSTITVQPGAEEVAEAMRATAVTQVGDDEDRSFLVRAVAEPHRLRLDMPYYSFGKVLTRNSK